MVLLFFAFSIRPSSVDFCRRSIDAVSKLGLFVKICYADYNDNFSPDLKLVVKYDDLADCPKNDVAIDS